MRPFGLAAALLITAGPVAADSEVVFGPFVPGTGVWQTVPNGGFEADLAGWSQINPSRGTVAQSGVFPDPGDFPHAPNMGVAVATSNTFGSNGYGAMRSVPVTPGQTYVLSGFINVGGIDNPAGEATYLDLDDAPFDNHATAVPGRQGWQFVYAEFTPTTASVTVRLVRDGENFAGQQFYFDEIAITPVGDFQPPVASCPADLDGNGTLTLNDFAQFRNAYVAGDLAADFDGSGALTLADFVAFRTAYVAGCP